MRLDEVILNKQQVESLNSCLLKCGISYSIYDYDAHTLQELICIVFQRVDEVIDIANLTLELAQWLVSEGLELVVRQQLQIWLKDGTLKDIINEEIFRDLNDRINDILQDMENFKDEVKGIIDESKEIYIESMEPFYITECDLIVDNVQQGLAVHPITGEYYVASMYKTPNNSGEWATDYQHFQITRCRANGEKIDYMIFKNGGHGTEFGLEIDGNDTYIWNAWETSSITGGEPSSVGNSSIPGASVDHRIGRVKWQPNTIITPQNVEYGYQQPVPGYCVPTISSDNSYIAFRNDRNVYICDFAEVKAGRYGLLSSFIVPAEYYWLQGFTLDNKYFYWRSGTGTEYSGYSYMPDMLLKFEWQSGKLLEVRNLDSFTSPLDGFTEPEGIHLHIDEEGYKTLFLGTTHGQTLGGRRRCVYAIGRAGAIQAIGGALKPTDFEPWRISTGRTKKIPEGTTKLSSFTTPGWYYIAGTQYQQMTDLPSAFYGGGWVFNSPMNSDRHVLQIYYRNTQENMFVVQRVVETNTGKVGRWAGSGQEETLFETTSAKSVGSTITLINGRSFDDFDYIIIKYSGGTGGNGDEQVIYRPYLGTQIIKSGINMADSSPTTVYAYEHAILMNETKTAFTITRRNCVKSTSSSNWEEVSSENAIYISRIIGMNG